MDDREEFVKAVVTKLYNLANRPEIFDVSIRTFDIDDARNQETWTTFSAEVTKIKGRFDVEETTITIEGYKNNRRIHEVILNVGI